MKQLNFIAAKLFLFIFFIPQLQAQMPAGWPNQFKKYYFQKRTGAAWDTVSQNTAFYNTDKKLKLIISLQKQDSVYMNYSKDSFVYTNKDSRVRLSECIHKIWFYNKWNNAEKTVFRFDVESRMKIRELYKWKGGAWALASRDSNLFDTDGKLCKVYHSSFNNAAYSNTSLDSFTFDNKWNAAYKYIKKWDGNKFTLDKRDVFDYNKSGLLNAIVNQQYGGGYYVDVSRYYFEYEPNMTDVGEEATAQTESVLLYPNPAMGEIHIIIPGNYNQNAVLRLYDVAGKEYQVTNYSNGNHIQADVLALPRGIYVINIICSNNRQYVLKFMRE